MRTVLLMLDDEQLPTFDFTKVNAAYFVPLFAPTAPPGPTRVSPPGNGDAIDYFGMFYDDVFLSSVVDMTNNHAILRAAATRKHAYGSWKVGRGGSVDRACDWQSSGRAIESHGDRLETLAISFTPLCQCLFGRDTKSRWSLLSGAYARGSKRSHTGGKCVTCCGLRPCSTWSIMSKRRWSNIV